MQRLLHLPRLLAFTAVLASAFATAANAQVYDPAPFVSRGDVAFGYTYIRSNAPPTGGPTFSAQGGFAAVNWNWRYAVSAVAEVSGTHANNISVLGQDLTLFTYEAGSRLTLHIGKTNLFGQALFGLAHGSDSYFPTTTGYTTTANTFAWSAGGGVDRSLNREWAVRVQAQYLHTAFPNGANNIQNHLAMSAGLVYRLGGRFSKPHGLRMKPVHAETPMETTTVSETSKTSPAASAQTSSAPTATQPDYKPFTPPASTSQLNQNVAADTSWNENIKAVYFEEGGYGLDTKALSSLSQAISYLKVHPDVHVSLRGYDDVSGNFDLVLGVRRANAVREALIAGGISADRIRVNTEQSRLPNCAASDDTCKQQSHRVEITGER